MSHRKLEQTSIMTSDYNCNRRCIIFFNDQARMQRLYITFIEHKLCNEKQVTGSCTTHTKQRLN